MFDFSSVIQLFQLEPGSGALQSILLAMIWWQCRGARKDWKEGKKQLQNHEERITVLEDNAEIKTIKEGK